MSLMSIRRGTKRKFDDAMDDPSNSPETPSLRRSMFSSVPYIGSFLESVASRFSPRVPSPSSGNKRIALEPERLLIPGRFPQTPEPDFHDGGEAPLVSMLWHTSQEAHSQHIPATLSTTEDAYWNGIAKETGIRNVPPPNVESKQYRPLSSHSQRRKSRPSSIQKRKPTRRSNPELVIPKSPIAPDQVGKDDEETPDSAAELESKMRAMVGQWVSRQRLMALNASRLRLVGGQQPSTEPRRSRKLQEKSAALQARSKALDAHDVQTDPKLEQAIRRLTEKFMLDLDRFMKEEEEEGEREPTPAPPPPFIKPLSDEARARIPTYDDMRQFPAHQVALFNRNPVLHSDLLKILPGARSGGGAPADWLNDNAINAFFDALCIAARKTLDEKLARDGAPIRDNVPRFHALNTTWFPSMGKGYASVKNWAKRAKCGGKDLLSVERLFIPIHLPSHWVLAVVYPTAREVWAYDSMNSAGALDNVLHIVCEYLANELGPHWHRDEWRFARGESGTQSNTNDCGVYACLNAWATFYGQPARLVGSRDLSDARETMTAIFMAGGFVGEFDLEAYHEPLRLVREEDAATNGTATNGA